MRGLFYSLSYELTLISPECILKIDALIKEVLPMALKNPRKYVDRVNSTHRLDREVANALHECVRLDPDGRNVSDIVNDALRNYPDIARFIKKPQ
jgi:predicted nucleic acid-binding protein